MYIYVCKICIFQENLNLMIFDDTGEVLLSCLGTIKVLWLCFFLKSSFVLEVFPEVITDKTLQCLYLPQKASAAGGFRV